MGGFVAPGKLPPDTCTHFDKVLFLGYWSETGTQQPNISDLQSNSLS